MLLTVGVIGPAHALKGEVRIDVRTDDPDTRLEPGTVMPTEPESAGPLTIERLRFDGQRYFAIFQEAHDRTAAENLRGVKLLVDVDDEEESDDNDDAWYPHQIVGMACEMEDGTPLGEVISLQPGIAQDRLVVLTPEGEEVLVPFVRELVPEIDEESFTVVINPPGGLFPGIGQAEEAR
ncbi:ribosome maturation factor RimM [Actinomyces vulturis]|uniref:ribosome maturation factor RimM n=1 Tax=Actinomyces vulturis TaxID=1857645 RepID=UPI0008338DAB|nr:ribosome maturation factor RimM [Actinomyces vulturis]